MTKKDIKKRILHVDDDDDVRVIIKMILEKEGYEVVGAHLGKEALKILKHEKFDLLLLDIMMPDISGWELFNLVKEATPDINVVILSIIKIDQEKINDLKKLGLKDYITKPFARQDLVDRINKIIVKT